MYKTDEPTGLCFSNLTISPLFHFLSYIPPPLFFSFSALNPVRGTTVRREGTQGNVDRFTAQYRNIRKYAFGSQIPKQAVIGHIVVFTHFLGDSRRKYFFMRFQGTFFFQEILGDFRRQRPLPQQGHQPIFFYIFLKQT